MFDGDDSASRHGVVGHWGRVSYNKEEIISKAACRNLQDAYWLVGQGPIEWTWCI